MANSYGFLVHPYLTLKKISRDRSQLAIFASLWFGVWIGAVLILGILWLMMKFLPPALVFAKFGTWLVGIGTIFLLIFTVYLLYWLRVFLKRGENK